MRFCAWENDVQAARMTKESGKSAGQVKRRSEKDSKAAGIKVFFFFGKTP
jgi:hypothetical protein